MTKYVALVAVLFLGCTVDYTPPAVDGGVVGDSAPDPALCEPLHAGYEAALSSLHAQHYLCADGFDAFGCILQRPLTSEEVDACNAALLAHATSCAALQNALWACEGGTP